MKTEFYELDKLVNVDKPQLILLGARPGMGKSTLALNLGTNIALHQNIPVLFFSLEENYLDSNMKELNYYELMKPSDDLPFSCIAEKIISSEEMIKKDYFMKIRNSYFCAEKELDLEFLTYDEMIDEIKIRKTQTNCESEIDKSDLEIEQLLYYKK